MEKQSSRRPQLDMALTQALQSMIYKLILQTLKSYTDLLSCQKLSEIYYFLFHAFMFLLA